MSLNGKHCVLFRTRISAIRPSYSSKRRVYISTLCRVSISILCLLFIPCCGRATWEISGRRGVLNPLSFSMSPILPFIRLPVVVEVVSRVTGPRPGNCRGARRHLGALQARPGDDDELLFIYTATGCPPARVMHTRTVGNLTQKGHATRYSVI